MKTAIIIFISVFTFSSIGQIEIPICDSIKLPSNHSVKLNGQYKQCLDGDLTFIASYKDGKLDGPYTKYGKTKCSSHDCEGDHAYKLTGAYQNGLKEGKWEFINEFPNNYIRKIRKISNYKNGKLNGKYSEYITEDFSDVGPVERLQKQGVYRDGIESGKWFYEYTGTRTTIHFKDGVYHGEYRKWWIGGGDEARGNYANGKREGEWLDWTLRSNKNLNGNKELPVYKNGIIISHRYKKSHFEKREEEKLFLRILLISIVIIALIIGGTMFGWQRTFQLVTNSLNYSKSLLNVAFNSKTLPVISLVLNILCWILLFFIRVPGGSVNNVITKVFFGILLIIPLTLSIISVSIKNENGRITLAILAIIGALLFLIPNLFFDY